MQIETILLEQGHDPRAAAAGWRSNDPLVVAILFASQGFPVFPCNKFKRPLTRNGLYDATCDLRTILYWDRDKPVYGWCVRSGRYEQAEPAGLWILDIDDQAGYARLDELEAELGPLPKTWTNKSGRAGGGEHRLFKPSSDGPDMKTIGKAMILGSRGNIDQKGRGGYAVIAGSHHASGKRYHWEAGCAPDETELARLPAKWIAAIDKAGVPSAPQRTTKPLPASRARPDHDPSSLLIGDGVGFGGFQNPIYKLAIRYFFNAGIEAPAEPIVETIRAAIFEAPQAPGRDVSRYLSGPDLERIVERARTFVIGVEAENG